MKRLLATLGLLAAFGAAQAAAQPAAPTGVLPFDQDTELDQALERLQRAARERGATAEVYERWKNALIQRARAGRQANPEVADYTSRFEALAKDLHTRIEGGKIQDTDFGRVREVTLEARIDWAVADLQRQARARGATREMYERALHLLRERATAATQTNPETPYRSAPLEAALKEIETRGTADEEMTRREFALLQEQILRARLESALADLERMARARGASRALYERWRNALTDWAAAAAPLWPEATKAKADLLAEITAIEKQEAAGKEVLTQFKSLRDRLGKTTKEAGAAVAKPAAARKVGGK